MSAQELGQLPPLIFAFPQECTGQLAYFEPTLHFSRYSYYAGYARGPRPSMAPNIRQLNGLALGAAAPPHRTAVERLRGGGDFWAEWSHEVRETPEGEGATAAAARRPECWNTTWKLIQSA